MTAMMTMNLLRTSQWPIRLDLALVRLMSTSANLSKMSRMPSSGGQLITMFIQTFFVWHWTILVYLVIFSLISITKYISNSYINCCQVCLLARLPTPIIHSELALSFNPACTSVSGLLGVPQSYLHGRSSGGCLGNFKEEVGVIRCRACWIVTICSEISIHFV